MSMMTSSTRNLPKRDSLSPAYKHNYATGEWRWFDVNIERDSLSPAYKHNYATSEWRWFDLNMEHDCVATLESYTIAPDKML